MKKMFFYSLIIFLSMQKCHAQARETPTYRTRYQKTHYPQKPSISLQNDIEDLKISTGKSNGEINTIIKQAEKNITHLEKEAMRQEALLQENAQNGFKKIHARIISEIEKIRQDEQKMAKQLQKQIDTEAKKLRLSTEKRALDIIEQAELDALTLKRKKREARLAEKMKASGIVLETPDKQKRAPLTNHKPLYITHTHESTHTHEPDKKHQLSSEWKNQIARSLYQNTNFIRKIITEAETPQQTKDFMQRFDQQNLWFDKTLRATQRTSDPAYTKLVQKQSLFERIVAAQKEADAVLEKLELNMQLAPAQKQKIRLMMLYDLSALIQQKMTEQHPTAFKALAEHEITGLAKRVLEEFSLQCKQQAGDFPDVTLVGQKTTMIPPIADLKLQQELKQTQAQLTQTKNDLKVEKEHTQKIYKIAEAKIHELTNGQTDAEISLVQAHEQLSHLNQQAAHEKETAVELVKSSMFTQFAPQLETKEKRNLELQILLEDTTQKADYFKNIAQKLKSDQEVLKERLVITEQKFEEEQIRHQLDTKTQTQSVQEAAQKTIASLNESLNQTRNEMKQLIANLEKQTAQFAKDNTRLAHEQELFNKEQKQLVHYKKALQEEQELLKKLKQETKRIVENSTKVTTENAIELAKLQQQASAELKKIAQLAVQGHNLTAIHNLEEVEEELEEA